MKGRFAECGGAGRAAGGCGVAGMEGVVVGGDWGVLVGGIGAGLRVEEGHWAAGESGGSHGWRKAG